MKPTRWFLPAGLPALLLGCVRSQTEPSAATVRDSSGIVIVENGPFAQADSTVWFADTANIVRFGEMDGDDPYVFGRIVGLTRLANGNIAVGDALANQVRFFDGAGHFLHAVGRGGSGPGEYINFHRLLPFRGDSLVVVDYEGLRNNVLDANGRYVRSFARPLRTDYRTDQAGIFDDGSILMNRMQSSPCDIRTTNVLCVTTARYNRFSAEGDSLATFGTMVNERHYTIPVEKSFLYSAMDRYPQGYWAQHGGRFYHTDAERAEIRV